MSGGHKCGGCQHFQKRKNDDFSSGICLLHDTRTNTDSGCSKWKGIPYNRKSNKNIIIKNDNGE